MARGLGGGVGVLWSGRTGVLCIYWGSEEFDVLGKEVFF